MQEPGRAGRSQRCWKSARPRPAGHGPPLLPDARRGSGCRRCARAATIGRSCWTASAELYLLGAERRLGRLRSRLPAHSGCPAHLSLRAHAALVRAQGGASLARRAGQRPDAASALGRAGVPSALETTIFEARLSVRSPKYLVDHQVQGSPVVPAAAYVEQGLAAAEQVFGPGRTGWRTSRSSRPCSSPRDRPHGASDLLARAGGLCSFETYSLPAESESAGSRWALHACGAPPSGGGPDRTASCREFDEVRSRTVRGTRATTSTKIF